MRLGLLFSCKSQFVFTYRFIIVHYRMGVKHFFVDGGRKCVVYLQEGRRRWDAGRTQEKINSSGRGFGV